jgi:hypothetical protein
MAAIDRIVINEQGSLRTMTPAQWKAMPLANRVRLLGSNVTFYAGQEIVSSKEALAQLR